MVKSLNVAQDNNRLGHKREQDCQKRIIEIRRVIKERVETDPLRDSSAIMTVTRLLFLFVDHRRQIPNESAQSRSVAKAP